jgi:murein DD-endopeptidase MepM/ murein hydrolase activator NlpD
VRPRALGLGLAVAVALAASPGVRAGGARSEAHARGKASAPVAGADADAIVRTALARQLDDQTAAAERAIALVTDKLAAAQLARANRLRAAYRLIHGAPRAGDDAMAIARVRAAARLILERDRHERDTLAGELAQLRAARQRIASELAQLPSVVVPAGLARPAAGKIVRRFGTLEHERSKATLARRGIDIEVEDRGPITAPAAGVVRFTGPIRGLDHGVIIDHGSYVTVVAKLRDVAVPSGASVAIGDRLGRAARYRVYLEVRIKLGPGGLPIDPEPLLANPR